MCWLKFGIKLLDDQKTDSEDNNEKAWNHKTHSRKTRKSPIIYNSCPVTCHGLAENNKRLGSEIRELIAFSLSLKCFVLCLIYKGCCKQN